VPRWNNTVSTAAARVRVFRLVFVLRHRSLWLASFGMPGLPPPNEALAELAAVLGVDNVRTLVRTFLRDFPVSFHALSAGERHDRHRLAHSMKSNSRLMGALALSLRMAELEARLSEDNGCDVTPDDLNQISAEFEAVAAPLRQFVAE
jgi:HPt (histidine-containing phosphotransfer) domain-containing protein